MSLRPARSTMRPAPSRRGVAAPRPRPAPKPSPAGPDESAYQCRLMRQVRSQIPRLPELAFFHSVPNSTKTSHAIAARMVREGVVAGVHDLHFDLARGGWHGLTIEMKMEGKTLRAEQKAFAAFYASQGILSVRCLTDVEAWAVITWYCALPPTPALPRTPLPPTLSHMAAPTEHRYQSHEARLAANAKRRRTLAEKKATEKKPTEKKPQDVTQTTPTVNRTVKNRTVKNRTVKYPVRG